MKSKNTTVSFRLGAKEKKLIQQLADKQGISKAKFLESIIKPYLLQQTEKLKPSKTKYKHILQGLSLEDEPNHVKTIQEIVADLGKDETPLKLKIQLIPKSNWRKTVRSVRPSAIWKAIKEEQLKKFNNQCAFCYEKDRTLHCHEVWDINHENLTQSLKGFKIVCDNCHNCIHWGAMKKFDTDGELEKVITAHFLKVNNCDLPTLQKHRTEEFNLFSKHQNDHYQIDYAGYAQKLTDLAQEI